jgi:hypothetical protein
MRQVLISLMFVLMFVLISCGEDDNSAKNGLGEICAEILDCNDDSKITDRTAWIDIEKMF